MASRPGPQAPWRRGPEAVRQPVFQTSTVNNRRPTANRQPPPANPGPPGTNIQVVSWSGSGMSRPPDRVGLSHDLPTGQVRDLALRRWAHARAGDAGRVAGLRRDLDRGFPAGGPGPPPAVS